MSTSPKRPGRGSAGSIRSPITSSRRRRREPSAARSCVDTGRRYSRS
jgi:hypothetical protein